MENTTTFDKKLQSKFGFPIAIFNHVYQHNSAARFVTYRMAKKSEQMRQLKKQISEAKKKLNAYLLTSFVLEYEIAHGLADSTDSYFTKTFDKEVRKDARKRAEEAYKTLNGLLYSYKKAQAIHTRCWLELKKHINKCVEVIKVQNNTFADAGDIAGLPKMN